jgi:hypothetical protein
MIPQAERIDRLRQRRRQRYDPRAQAIPQHLLHALPLRPRLYHNRLSPR